MEQQDFSPSFFFFTQLIAVHSNLNAELMLPLPGCRVMETDNRMMECRFTGGFSQFWTPSKRVLLSNCTKHSSIHTHLIVKLTVLFACTVVQGQNIYGTSQKNAHLLHWAEWRNKAPDSYWPYISCFSWWISLSIGYNWTCRPHLLQLSINCYKLDKTYLMQQLHILSIKK